MEAPADEKTSLHPSFEDIVDATTRIRGVANRTPVITSRTTNALANATLFFKAENFQRTGSFKFRGAYNTIAALTEEERRRGVAAYSSGNHAQAIAYAAKLQGVKTAIVMPSDAPGVKIMATRGYGAEVILYDRYKEDREAIGKRLADERGAALIPPYDHPQVIAGQGTAALELFEEVGPLDILLVPLGGGGLLSGCALAATAKSPGCRIVGVEPEAGSDGQRSFREGKIVTISPPRSIADGALATRLGDHTFRVIRSLVHDVVTVPDDLLIRTIRFFAERIKIVVEPTGCLAAAAALFGEYPCANKRVGIVLSGGNVDTNTLSLFLQNKGAST
jgi:threonine dehydratase